MKEIAGTAQRHAPAVERQRLSPGLLRTNTGKRGYRDEVSSIMAPAINCRDKGSAIAQKHGNTLIRTLRVKYGYTFAEGESNLAKLIDVLDRLDEHSLHQLIRDHGR